MDDFGNDGAFGQLMVLSIQNSVLSTLLGSENEIGNERCFGLSYLTSPYIPCVLAVEGVVVDVKGW